MAGDGDASRRSGRQPHRHSAYVAQPAGDDKATLPNGLPARKTLGSQGVAWLGRRDVDAIIVGENIDAALAASEYGDETWPHWVLTPVAAISATGLARFVIPRNIRRLYISEDADPEGRQATKAVVRTARSSGVRVLILRVTLLDEEGA